jgi:23S rRNA (uracil1939-C5)-methyltransferase
MTKASLMAALSDKVPNSRGLTAGPEDGEGALDPAVKPREFGGSQLAYVEKLTHDGRGLARIDGKATFIEGALPGEKISIKYTKRKKDFDEAAIESILEASPKRVAPLCSHFQLCGGCNLQHLDAKAQIYEKQTLLLDILQRIGHVQPSSVLSPLSSQSWNYRNKARLSTRYVRKKGVTLVGFREKNKPQFVADIEHCPILNAKIANQIKMLAQLVDTLSSPSSIAQIELAAGDEDLALIFRNLEELTAEDKQILCNFAKENNFKLFLQPGGTDSVVRIYPEIGDDYLYYSLPSENIDFACHPTDFTQVNANLNRDMIGLALDLMDIQKEDIIADVFCGLGNFSLPLARRCAQVIGIEGSDKMIARAKMNAESNKIFNANFYCADLEQEDSLSLLCGKSINKMLMDPPRSGALTLVQQFNQLSIQRLVYVSCNPATLARDADILVNQQGYTLRAAGVMDMFPHTAHVESIALFDRG